MKNILALIALVSFLVPAVVLVMTGIKKVIEKKNCWLPTGLFCLFAVPSAFALLLTTTTLFTTISWSERINALFYLVIFGLVLLGAVVGLLVCWLLIRSTRKSR